MTAWNLDGQPVVITGASRGIGRATARALAKLGAELILIGRDRGRHQAVLDEVKREGARASLIETDLTDLAAVAAAGRSVVQMPRPPAVLINNAGVTGRSVTADGFDLAFGVNHLAHFLLTMTLLPRLCPAARIINVSSNAHYGLRPFTWESAAHPRATLTGFTQYRRSKAANVAFTAGLAHRMSPAEVVPVAVHPGLVATNLWRRIPRPVRGWVMSGMTTPEQGAQVTIHCATSPSLEAGAYYTPAGTRPPAPYASEPEAVSRLWELSESLVGQWL